MKVHGGNESRGKSSGMNPFSLLVKPVGAACNFNCSYCFYGRHAPGVMSETTFRSMLDSYCDLPFADKAVALQGGEPLLAPDFVFAALEERMLMRSLQTNASLVTPKVAERLKMGGWLVGASLDGPREFNALRMSGGSRDKAFDEAVAGIRNLEKHDVDYNLLTVVSRANVAHAREIYRYLRDSFSTRYHQYIECTGPRDEITAVEWGAFLCDLFDEWSKKDAYTVSIRLFDSIVSRIVRGVHTQCSFAGRCDSYLVVEHDGSVYPCDFHVREDLKLGNVMTHTWEEMLSCEIYRNFAEAKSSSLPDECHDCEYFAFCGGDCPRNRTMKGMRFRERSVLCAGWKKFFSHSLKKFEKIIRQAGV